MHEVSMKTCFYLLISLWPVLLIGQEAADSPGLYYKSGGIGQDQWYQIRSTEDGVFAVTDMYGQGLTTDFADGQFSIAADGRISFTGSNSGYDLDRVINTDSDFPLTLDTPFPANPLFAGDWDIVEINIDPITGQPRRLAGGGFEFIDVFTLSIHDQAVRFTDSNGIYFQGAANGSHSVVFRTLKNPTINIPTTGPYANILGSDNNFPRDMIGTATFTDINHFEVLLPIQDYTVTPWNQFLLKITGTRVDPLPAGDINGDRVVDDADRALLLAQIGLSQSFAGYNIAADLNGDAVIDHRDVKIFDGETVTTQAVNTGMTAQWYDPSHDGEGWDLQILADNRANLSWYTYDTEGKQMWLVGVGQVSGDEIFFPQMALATTGTVFGADFNPDEVVLTDWGSVRFYFESCHQAGMTYQSILGFGHGGLQPTRLTLHAGTDCENDTVDANQINPFTGMWYDPSHNGEGWAIQVRENNQISLSWFTYDQHGELMWLVGVGEINGNTLTVAQLAITRGGVFGPDFNPDEVTRELWGSLQFTLDGCHQGTLTYQAVDPIFSSGTLQPIRLASVGALDCVEVNQQ